MIFTEREPRKVAASSPLPKRPPIRAAHARILRTRRPSSSASSRGSAMATDPARGLAVVDAIEDHVAHDPTHEVDHMAGGGEAPGQRPDVVEDGLQPLGDHVARG